MDEFSLSNVIAGWVAYALAFFIGVVPLVHWIFFRLHIATTKEDEEKLLLDGNQAVAVDLGSTIVCQAILARHAVYATMAVVRGFFVEELTRGEQFWMGFRTLLIFVSLTGLSFFSIWFAGRIFREMTKRLREAEEIKKGNVAVAIFSGLVLLAVTLILNDGMEDLSQSLIPYARSGVIQW